MPRPGLWNIAHGRRWEQWWKSGRKRWPKKQNRQVFKWSKMWCKTRIVKQEQEKRPTYADAPWDKCWTLSSRGLDRVASAASSFFTSQAKSDQVWSTRSTYCNATAISYQLPTSCTKKILALSDLHVSLHISLCPACLHCHLQLHKRRLRCGDGSCKAC